MFSGIKVRMFLAKIQAEVKAQYNDQRFVNKVCQIPSTLEQLGVLRTQAYYKDRKEEPFLTVCYILGEAMESDQLSFEDREISASLLAQRLEKVSSDPQFRLEHIMMIGDLEKKMVRWAEQNRNA